MALKLISLGVQTVLIVNLITIVLRMVKSRKDIVIMPTIDT